MVDRAEGYRSFAGLKKNRIDLTSIISVGFLAGTVQFRSDGKTEMFRPDGPDQKYAFRACFQNVHWLKNILYAQ